MIPASTEIFRTYVFLQLFVRKIADCCDCSCLILVIALVILLPTRIEIGEAVFHDVVA